ncbi:MAG: hypothetical protein E6K94_08950 [Thaumarchaeota archaeon]|jgi:hypothetical protein|nr:MAG: hypothetical protein E6L03_04805 [Nitrososphaerota archaeon]TLX89879.1 MAG: hypothetical protein E6K94_08950 [Nitrososphaerota archaeon]
MPDFSFEEKLLLIQHCIYKYDSEEMLKTKLKQYFSPKEIESMIDTLIATQKIRRIGQDKLQNNESHTGMVPEIPENLQSIINNL